MGILDLQSASSNENSIAVGSKNGSNAVPGEDRNVYISINDWNLDLTQFRILL